MKDFFISYNKNDKTKAKWIGGCLEQNGYSVIIQAWDFKIGNNFIIEMQKAVNEAERMIIVLSQSYIASDFCQAEWASIFAKDPTGEKRLLIPIRVEEIELSGFFYPSIYIDLFNINEQDARKRLLQAVDKNRNPRKIPAFSNAFPDNTRSNAQNNFVQYNQEKKLISAFEEFKNYYFEDINKINSYLEEKDISLEEVLKCTFKICKKFCDKYDSSHEIIFALGIRGLYKAISTFDVSKNIHFSSYIGRVIENEILIAFNVSYQEENMESFEKEELKDVLIIRNDSKEDADDTYFQEVVLEYINNKMDNIEKSIIKYRYGFCGQKMTQREVSNVLGVPRSYIDRVEKRALIKMQNYFDNKVGE